MSTTERDKFEEWCKRSPIAQMYHSGIIVYEPNDEKFQMWNACAESKQAEIDKLRAEVERITRQSADRLVGLCKAGDDNDKLRAELAEYQNMKPIGTVSMSKEFKVEYDWAECINQAVSVGSQLFAHPPKEKTE